MNSQERHEARYQRRKARREQRAREAGGASFEEVMSFGNICKAGKSCCDGARWKTSTINFETNLLGEAQATYDTLHYGKRVFKGFHSFATVEHGKVRNIDALPIQERAIQKCLCKNLLTEVYSRSFIYDNSASLKDRGMDFQLRRLRKHLQDHYRRYGTEGGIYQFDFKNYFGSLPHEEIKRNLYRLAEALGIAMSDKKNIITPFRHHSFTFLKMRVTLTETGKVVMKLSRKSIRAMRRKMDIFRRWMDEGRMGPEDVFQSYQSWRAHAKRCNSYDTLRAMDERFTRMFAEELAGRRKPFPCTMKATRTGCGWIYRRHGAVIEEEMCA